MTLVELMVAVVLSAMLLGALVGVLSSVAKQSKLADTYDQPLWPAEFMSLLRRDLLAADAIWSDAGVIWIRTDAPTYAVQSGAKGTSGMRRIGYRCSPTHESRSLLIRSDKGQAAVLAIGPTQLTLERLDDSGSPQPLPPSPGPMPEQVRIWVWQGTSEGPIIVRDLVLR